jgi:2-phosphosulfolactate phosphatase
VGGVCVVIDVLRATTTLTTLLACGVTEVAVAADAAAARAAKRANPTAILLGEIGGLRPPDFDLGNSPRDITPRIVAGRQAICSTSNGTAAIRAVAAAPVVLLGCLRNATAAALAALAASAQGDRPITIVCSGGGGGLDFALDDTLVAGQIVAALIAATHSTTSPIFLTDAALAAHSLRQSAIGPAQEPAHDHWAGVLSRTTAGQHLTQIGLGEDIPFCAQVDRETTVPRVRTVAGVVQASAAAALAGSRA